MKNINDLNQSDGVRSDSGFATPDTSEIDLKFLFGQIRRNRLLLTGSLLLGLLIGMLAYLSSTREYTAETTLMINLEGEEITQQSAAVLGGLGLGPSNAIAPAYAIARSSALIEQVVDEMRLVEDPEFNSTLRDPTLKQQVIGTIKFVLSTVKDFVQPDTGPEPARPAWADPDILARRTTIRAVKGSVDVTDLKDDLRLEISVTTEDREKSSKIANLTAEKLNKFMQNAKTSALEKAQEWIEGEAGRVQGALAEIEGEINAEISKGTVLPDSEALGENAQRLVEGELILEANRRRGQALSRLGEVIARIEGGDNPQSAFATLPDDLRTELVGDYIDIFRWERRDEPPSKAELLSAARLIERDLETQTLATNRRVQDILPVRVYTRKLSSAQNRYRQLQTSYEAQKALLGTLKERLAELQIERAGEVQRMLVLESAQPSLRHSSPSLTRMLAIYSLLGLMLGGLIMFVRYFKRDAFVSLEDVEDTFGAPTLSIVSDIRKGLREGFAWSSLTNEIQEAYRRAYAAVFVMPDEQGSRSLMVTSSIPSEGKTTTSLYIAAAAAEEGRKTLVIDLDFRKRSVSRYLGLKRPLGVYSVFRGEATLQEAAMPYEYNVGQFDVLTTDGRHRSKGEHNRETLSARNVRELVDAAKEEYEVVIVDVPPILAVQDANMIGRMVDAVVCVVSTQDLKKGAANRAAKEWRRAGLKLFGLVVRGEQTELYEYYGYSYYHYDYAAKEDGRIRRPSQRRRRRRSEVGRHQASSGARD